MRVLPIAVRFGCPLCREKTTRPTEIVAELDATTPWLTVGNLSGCPHAAAFGKLQALTARQERRLIHAALMAARRASHGRPGPRRRS